MNTAPEWHATQHPDYDKVLSTLGAEEAHKLQTGDRSYIESFLRDTRAVHRRLYERLAPAGFPEYAGTYRGTPNTSLANRNTGASCVTREGHYTFITSDKVHAYLNLAFTKKVDELIAAAGTEDAAQYFRRSAELFYLFGLIHPYLDGNGHIQRMIFMAAISLHPKLVISQQWTVHPRPYDIEMAKAFEAPENASAAVTAELAAYIQLRDDVA